MSSLSSIGIVSSTGDGAAAKQESSGEAEQSGRKADGGNYDDDRTSRPDRRRGSSSEAGSRGLLGELLRQSDKKSAADAMKISPGNPFAAPASSVPVSATDSVATSPGNPFAAAATAETAPAAGRDAANAEHPGHHSITSTSRARPRPPPPPPPPSHDSAGSLIGKVNTLNPTFVPPLRGPSPVYKIILIGSANVGKTNLLRVFTENGFDARSPPTLKPEFVERTVPHPDCSGRVLRAMQSKVDGRKLRETHACASAESPSRTPSPGPPPAYKPPGSLSWRKLS